jgi:biopolymer transport protein TolR
MSEINVTPLVDVMLVLVVIFIITAPLLASSLKLELPKSEAAKPTEAPRFVAIGIDKAGTLFYNNETVSPPQLAAKLKAAAQDNPDTELQLRADAGVPYSRIVDVMSIAQAAGLNRVGFIAEAAK